MATLTLAAARRIALAAQGFADPRPAPGTAGTRHLTRVVDRVQVVQIDSVNVLTRSHYLPFFSRLGPYPREALDRLRDGSGPRSRAPRRLVEYWAHEASLIPPSTWPLLGRRMRAAADGAWAAWFEREHPGVLDEVLQAVQTHGPVTARQAEQVLEHDAPRARDHWGWNWSLVKRALEHLFRLGQITSVGRTAQFERRYADPSRALSAQVLARAPGLPSAPTDEEAVLELVRLSARAHGIGSELCLRDYFRLPSDVVRPALAELVRLGELDPVEVTGWGPAYLYAAARRPRAVPGRALLSPFDSLVWQRERTEALFGFRYRIEIYVPRERRVHGYYVLPFLLDEHMVARVDLKADRATGRLIVQSTHLEPGAPPQTTDQLREELVTMAAWLELDGVDVVSSGQG